MMTQLESKLNSFSSLFQVEWSQVRCLAHAINLAVKQFLKTLFHSEKDHEFEITSDPETSDSSQSDQEDTYITPNNLKSLTKIRAIIRKIRKSILLRQQFHRECISCGLPKRNPVIDVKTHWNSTFYMLEFAIKFMGPLNRICQYDKKLEKYSL
ncbi:hypothetical protein HK096_000810, partial [Nowakowskiella sp. JEL0078]